MDTLVEFGKRMTPLKLRNYFQKLGLRAGYRTISDSVSMIFFASIIIDILVLIGMFPYLQENYSGNYFILLIVFLLFAGFLIIYFVLVSLYLLFLQYKAYNRTRKMEDVLPDFLAQFSENVKSGMTLDLALAKSLRPEHGVIFEEMTLVIKNIMTGVDVSVALRKFINQYHSNVLNRNFTLIIEAIEGGGKISDIVDSIVDELRKTKRIKEEMFTSVLSYAIFISLIVVFIAPALFAASKELLVIMSDFLDTLAATSGKLPINVQKIGITPKDFSLFSMMALGVISIFSGFILGIFRTGKLRDGFKYLPFLVLLSLLFFYIMSTMIHNLVGVFG